MIMTDRIFSQEMGTEFATEKCATLIKYAGKRDNRIQKDIKMLGEKENSKYQGILEEVSRNQKWKKNLEKNTWEEQINYWKPNSAAGSKRVGSLVKYSGPFLNWTRDYIKNTDYRPMKLVAMHKVLHLRDDVDRLYVKRNEERRRFPGIEGWVRATILVCVWFTFMAYRLFLII